MPSFPTGPYANDPSDPFALFRCDHCGLDAFRLRPIGDALSRMLLCDTCYDRDLGLPEGAPTQPAIPTVPWHPGLPLDELRGCTPEPQPDATYCAAAYLVALESSGCTFVPRGVASLCQAHWNATLDDAIRQFPKLGTTEPQRLSWFASFLADVYVRAAEQVARRIAERIG